MNKGERIMSIETSKAISPEELEQVSGGVMETGRSGQLVRRVFVCQDCTKQFETREELEAHQAETGHKRFAESVAH